MGKTVVFSSHLLEQVQEVADRVAIFSLGKKVLEGSLDTLLVENRGTQIALADELTAGQQARVSELLRQEGVDFRFSKPHLSLEQLYLRTVQAPGQTEPSAARK
jgi:ABC-2 type transport system ATP-binding protein